MWSSHSSCTRAIERRVSTHSLKLYTGLVSHCSNGLRSYNIFSLTALFVSGNEVCCIQTVTLLILVASSLSSFLTPPSFIPSSSECEDAHWQSVLTRGFGPSSLSRHRSHRSIPPWRSCFVYFLCSYFWPVTGCTHPSARLCMLHPRSRADGSLGITICFLFVASRKVRTIKMNGSLQTYTVNIW